MNDLFYIQTSSSYKINYFRVLTGQTRVIISSFLNRKKFKKKAITELSFKNAQTGYNVSSQAYKFYKSQLEYVVAAI